MASTKGINASMKQLQLKIRNISTEKKMQIASSSKQKIVEMIDKAVQTDASYIYELKLYLLKSQPGYK